MQSEHSDLWTSTFKALKRTLTSNIQSIKRIPLFFLCVVSVILLSQKTLRKIKKYERYYLISYFSHFFGFFSKSVLVVKWKITKNLHWPLTMCFEKTKGHVFNSKTHFCSNGAYIPVFWGFYDTFWDFLGLKDQILVKNCYK